MAGPRRGGAKEPGATPDASRDMSAHLQPSAAPSRPPSAMPGARTDAAFDRWLRQELSRLYDSALSEPVPPELLRLLKESDEG